MNLEALAEDLGKLSGDPYAHVMWAYPWGEPGTELEHFSGPESWQVGVLKKIRDGLLTPEQGIRAAIEYEEEEETRRVADKFLPTPSSKAELKSSTAPIQLAVASGHGVGKSALVAWIILWSISTFEDTRGVVTANTEAQLKGKTWAELGKWHRLFIARDLFKLTATALFNRDRERTWRIDMVAWSENNAEAFAGLHNQGKRVVLIMDEASTIADIIHETAEGALTDADTQIIWLMFGNPTRNTGRFKEAFPGGKHAHAWSTTQVDSRTVSFVNKAQIANWIKAYGEDSDFIRIRVKGVFPRTGMQEFISDADMEAAGLREIEPDPFAPLILGVDVARFGDDESVLFFRKGRDARSIPMRTYRNVSTTQLTSYIIVAVQELAVDMVFVDEGGVGGGVVDQLRERHVSCIGIQFGSAPDNYGFETKTEGERYANKRAEIWGALRGWLPGGAIPPDPDLRQQAVGPMYAFNNKDAIQLERKADMKKRGLASPDRADALALTFAMPVARRQTPLFPDQPQRPLIETDYDPLSNEALAA